MEITSHIADSFAAMRDENKLDPVRKRLLELVEREGKDMKALSLSLGRNNAYIQQFIDRGTPRELKESDIRKLARLLKCSPSELGLEDVHNSDNTVASSDRGMQPSVTGDRKFLTGAKDLPILGHVKGGDEGFFIDNGEIAGYAMRPHILDGVSDAYAVEVWDTSMEPRLDHGWVCWVHPRKPVKPGDDIVIQLHDGQALVKTLIRRTDGHVVLRQYNPAKDFKIERAAIKSMHLIVGNLRVMT